MRIDFSPWRPSHSIPVFWLLPPLPSRGSSRDAKGFTAYFTSRAAAFLKKYPNLTVIDSRRANYPERVFCDVAHMNRDGRIAFTAAVSELMNRVLTDPGASPRWLSLPTFRDVPTAIALEDLNESRRPSSVADPADLNAIRVRTISEAAPLGTNILRRRQLRTNRLALAQPRRAAVVP